MATTGELLNCDPQRDRLATARDLYRRVLHRRGPGVQVCGVIERAQRLAVDGGDHVTFAQADLGKQRGLLDRLEPEALGGKRRVERAREPAEIAKRRVQLAAGEGRGTADRGRAPR